MLEILGYMVVAYGVARLAQATFEAERRQQTGSIQNSIVVVAGVVGIAALVVLALMLHDQADKVGAIGGL